MLSLLILTCTMTAAPGRPAATMKVAVANAPSAADCAKAVAEINADPQGTLGLDAAKAKGIICVPSCIDPATAK